MRGTTATPPMNRARWAARALKRGRHAHSSAYGSAPLTAPRRHTPCCDPFERNANEDNHYAGHHRRSRASPAEARSPSRADRTAVGAADSSAHARRARHGSESGAACHRTHRTGWPADWRPAASTHANATSQYAAAVRFAAHATLTRLVRCATVRRGDFMYLLQSRRIFYRQFAVVTPRLY